MKTLTGKEFEYVTNVLLERKRHLIGKMKSVRKIKDLKDELEFVETILRKMYVDESQRTD